MRGSLSDHFVPWHVLEAAIDKDYPSCIPLPLRNLINDNFREWKTGIPNWIGQNEDCLLLLRKIHPEIRFEGMAARDKTRSNSKQTEGEMC